MITKNYIKMCEKTKEIQKAWKDKKSHVEDRIFIKEFDKDILITEEIEFYNDEETNKEYILFKKEPILPIPFTKWDKETFYQYDDGELNVIYLPTQEQLQEMLTMDTEYAKEYNKKEGAIFCGFYIFLNMMDWVRNYLKKPTIINCNSMNEIWLAFVMKEKYNKSWTGSKWVANE